MTPALTVVGVLGVAACLGAARRPGTTGSAPEGPAPEGPAPTGPATAARARGPRARAWAGALASAGIEGDAQRWARVAAAGVLATGGLVALRGGPVGGAVVAGVLVASLALALRVARGRGSRRADASLPDLLEHAARELRSGLDLVPALGSAAATVGGVHGDEVAAVVARVDRGATVVAALGPWSDAHPRPPVGLAVAALEVAAEAGGARAAALDGVAATLRARAVVADESRALASQARASAAVMVALPLVVAALGSAADPRLAHTLLGTPVGLGCVLVAALLDGAGAWWMQRVVDGAHR